MRKKDKCPRNHEPDFRVTLGHKTCRECDRERSKRRWKTPERRAYHYAYYKPRYEAGREIINRAKTRPCVDCGIQYSTWVMQFDHRDPLDKKFGIGVSGFRQSVKSILNEIAKCDVVCANCHSERTHKNESLMKLLRSEGRKKAIQNG